MPFAVIRNSDQQFIRDDWSFQKFDPEYGTTWAFKKLAQNFADKYNRMAKFWMSMDPSSDLHQRGVEMATAVVVPVRLEILYAVD